MYRILKKKSQKTEAESEFATIKAQKLIDVGKITLKEKNLRHLLTAFPLANVHPVIRMSFRFSFFFFTN